MLDIRKINLYGLSIPFKKNIETNWSKRSGTTSFLIEVKTKKNLSGYGEMIAFFPVEQCEITLKKMIRDIEGFKLNEISKMMNRALYGGGWMRTERLMILDCQRGPQLRWLYLMLFKNFKNLIS